MKICTQRTSIFQGDTLWHSAKPLERFSPDLPFTGFSSGSSLTFPSPSDFSKSFPFCGSSFSSGTSPFSPFCCTSANSLYLQQSSALTQVYSEFKVRSYRTHILQNTDLTEHRSHRTQISQNTDLTEHRSYRTQILQSTDLTEHRSYKTQILQNTDLTEHRSYRTQILQNTVLKQSLAIYMLLPGCSNENHLNFLESIQPCCN